MGEILATIINQAHCRSCGTIIAAEARACPHCGAGQAGVHQGASKSRVTAIILALFLGGFGIHKFYLGRPGQGILYVLFFWTFIPAIVAFIELIIYAVTDDQTFAEKYG